MPLLRKHLPIAVAFIMGVAMFLQFYIPTRQSNDFLSNVTQWDRIIASFALLLGIYSLLNHHFHKLRRLTPGWGFSVVVYVGFFAMTFAGLIWGIRNEPPTPLLDPNTGAVLSQVQEYVPFMWMYEYLFVPMQATMFSILAFYIASAAYRAFRARTREATVLLLTAIIVMLGRVPLGAFLITWHPFGGETEFLPWLTGWILNNPSMAAQRGIMIGIGLGMISTSLRIIFGIERTYMGGGD
jgi:hypothetical protein